MILHTLGASLLENMLARKGTVRASSAKGIVKGGYRNEMDFYCPFIHEQTLKYKSFIKRNQDLMVFILEII